GLDPSSGLAACRRADRQPGSPHGSSRRPIAARFAPAGADGASSRDTQCGAGQESSASNGNGRRHSSNVRRGGMTFTALLLRHLRFHWRGNFAVLLGVAVGTAVLTGALLVGDSLRGSLRDLTEQRLGWVDNALLAGRFIRESLATELRVDTAAQPNKVERASATIMLRGSLSKETEALEGKPSGGSERQVTGVTVVGSDLSFWFTLKDLG